MKTLATLLSDANRDRFLTARWNNILTLALGIPAIVFALLALFTDVFSDFAAFIALVVVASFY